MEILNRTLDKYCYKRWFNTFRLARLSYCVELAGLTLLLLPLACLAETPKPTQSLLVTLGGGPQPDAEQNHRSAGIDYNFYSWQLGPKRALLLGASYTYIKAKLDNGERDQLWAVSIYPQLNFYANTRSWGTPFIFARALGPSYLSQASLGTRQQEQYTFQAQMGAGIYLPKQAGSISLSWKHFSNANLSSQNDGIDIPLVLSLGINF